MLKKFLALFLTLALTLTLVSMSVFAVGNTAVKAQIGTSGTSGNCGTYSPGTYANNATFTLSDGVLTIDGTGGIGNNAFNGRTDITSVVFAPGSTISTIGLQAFYNCTNLASVNIPNTVTIIMMSAFQSTGLTGITIPDSVTTMSNYVFENCHSLTSATWNSMLTIIPDSTFERCDSLTSFTIPSTVTTIGQQAFRNTGLTSITIPNTVTTMGDRAFNSCSSLTSITIPDSVTIMGIQVFDSCASLTSATWNNTLTTIPVSTFSGCTSLEEVTLGTAVTSIGSWAFNNVNNVETLHFNCESLTETYSLFSRANLETLTIGSTVRTIPDYFMNGATELTSVTIPNTVTTIGGSAFHNTGLTSITIPNSVTTMYSAAFQACSDLTSVTWNSTLTTIPVQTFYGCTSLTSFTIPNTVTTIGDSAFYNTGLTSITIPSSVTTVDWDAFTGCESLTSAYFEGNVPTTICSGGPDPSFNDDAESNFNEYFAYGDYASDGESSDSGYTYDWYHNEGFGEPDSDDNYQTPYEFTGRAPSGLDYLLGYWYSCDPVEAWCEDEGFEAEDAAQWATEKFADDNDGRLLDFAAIAAKIDAALPLSEPQRHDKLLEAWKEFYFICDGREAAYSFPITTTLYYPLGNSSWEDAIVPNLDDGTFRLGEEDTFTGEPANLVATNAVAFVDEDGELLGDINFLSSGDTANQPAVGNQVIKHYYDVTADAPALSSYTATNDNVNGLYASSTPLMKVIKTDYEALGTVTKDSDDDKLLAGNATSYGGFDLFGVQVRQIEGDESNNGLRFVTSFSKDLMDRIHDFDDASVEYGYVVGVRSRIDTENSENSDKLYKGMPGTKTYNCTKSGNASDHQNYDNYRIFSLVITYNGADAVYKSTDIVARAYITYTDADGVSRTYYSDYTGTQVRGGICTNYDAATSYVNNVLKN